MDDRLSYIIEPMESFESSTDEEKKQLLLNTANSASPWLRLWYSCLPLSRGRCALLAAVGALGVFVMLRLTLLDTLVLMTRTKNGQHAHVSPSADLQQWSEQLAARIRREMDEPQTGPYALSSDGPADRSQNGQSCAVAAILGRNRTFLEAGAYNGEDLSNTLYLEKELGWTGVLVEPDPWNYWSLQKRNRKARSLNACLAPDTVASELVFKQSDTMGRLAASAEVSSKRGLFTRVRCYPLFAVLRAANLTRLDYLALDLEGLEMKVLQTVPWDNVQITFLQIEASHLDPLKMKSPGNSTRLSNKPKHKFKSPDISVSNTVSSKTKEYKSHVERSFPTKLSRTLQTIQGSSERFTAVKLFSTRMKNGEAFLNGCSPVAPILPRVNELTKGQRELAEFLKEKGYELLGVLGEDFMFARLDLLKNG